MPVVTPSELPAEAKIEQVDMFGETFTKVSWSSSEMVVDMNNHLVPRLSFSSTNRTEAEAVKNINTRLQQEGIITP